MQPPAARYSIKSEDTHMNLTFERKLPIPMEIKEQYPLTETAKAAKEKQDNRRHRTSAPANKFDFILKPFLSDFQKRFCCCVLPADK